MRHTIKSIKLQGVLRQVRGGHIEVCKDIYDNSFYLPQKHYHEDYHNETIPTLSRTHGKSIDSAVE